MYTHVIVATFLELLLSVLATTDTSNTHVNKFESAEMMVSKSTTDSNPVSVIGVMDRNIKHNLHNSLQGAKCNGAYCKLSNNKNVESMKNGTNFLIVKHFCLNSCVCWPLWAFSIAYLFCQFIIFLAFVHSSANIFTNGIWGKTFYTHGGLYLIIFSLLTGTIGGLVGYYKSFCIPVILALIGGSLNVGAAVILVGKRGGSLGFLSSATTGFILSCTISDDFFIIILTTIMFGIVGLGLGLIPFCKNLKMNIKYTERCDRLEDLNNYGSNESSNSDTSSRSRLLRAKTVGSYRPSI